MLLSTAIINENKEKINCQFPDMHSQTGAEISKDELEIAVIRFVQKLGIRSNLMGYPFLIKAIMLSLESPHLIKSLTKGLYPIIADYFGKDVRTIERNIRRAIESAYNYDPERVQAAFYYKVNKPYISEVLSLAVESIKYGH